MVQKFTRTAGKKQEEYLYFFKSCDKIKCLIIESIAILYGG